MTEVQKSQVLVVGTGPAGMVAAIALADAGFDVALAGPAARNDDARTTALMMPSLRFLERLGVAAELRAEAAPLRAMQIIDGTRRLVRSPPVTFHAGEIGEEAFGYNVPNAILNAALAKATAVRTRIARLVTTVSEWRPGADAIEAMLADGTTVAARLAVAADGRNSPGREAAGITTRTSSYPQSAVVLNFAHARHHGSVSTEFHTESGPCTQVPLPGGMRSSLVWVVDPATADELRTLDTEALSERLEARIESMLGHVAVEPGLQVYPLSGSLPLQFARNRVALVGEAAHVFPPIGAQGLNLGIRDVEDLVDTVVKNPSDPGSREVLRSYDRKRRPDILARSGAVRLLNRSLLSDLLPAQMMRSAGLGLLREFGPLRALFMREGLHPGGGFSSLFGDLREKVRR